MAEITSDQPLCQLQRLTSYRSHPFYKQMKTLIPIFFALEVDNIVVHNNSNKQEFKGSLTNRPTRLDPVT